MDETELVVRKDGHAEVATVEETVETTSTTYARVEGVGTSPDSQVGPQSDEGDHLEGWVEVPDNPETPKHVLVCEDCGREPNPGSDEPGPLRKENYCNHEGSANVLRDIHEARRPTHSPRVERRAA